MASIDNSEGGMPKLSGMADLIVKGAIVLVTAAIFIGAYLQFQMPFWQSFIAALSVCTVLFTVHVLKRRSERERELTGELARLENEVERLRAPEASNAPALGMRPPRAPTLAAPGSPRVPMPPPLSVGPSLSAGAPMGSAPPPPAPSAAGAEPSLSMAPGAGAPMAMASKAMPPKPPRIFRAEPPASAHGAAPGVAPAREPRLTTHRPGAPAAPQRAEPELSGPAGVKEPAAPKAAAGAPPAPKLKLDPSPGPGFGGPNLKAPSAPSSKADAPAPMLPDWSAPPPAPAASSDRVHAHWSSRQAKPTLPEAPRAEPPSFAADRETDLDAVHGMIKRLADEVDVGDEPTLEGLPQRQESVLRASLNALQTTANAMRATKKPGAGAAPAGPAMPPPIMPSHTRLASLAEAVASGRVDVAVAPIVGLADHQVHYHEVLARPCDERGTPLSVSTRDPQLAVAGLLPLLDSARLRQAAVVARTFADEGREACLFVPATAVSLANDGFLDDLAAAYQDRETLAREVVLTFAQADIRTFGNSEWSALTDMRDLGFRFAIEDVSDFDYGFTALCAAGFAFVKIDAGTLMAGLAAPNGTMPADEVCRNLGELGLTVIVSGIADEPMRDNVLAKGVPLGQGALFGAPLPVAGAGFAAANEAAA